MKKIKSTTPFVRLGIKPEYLLGLTFLFLMIAYWGGLTELVSRWEKQEEYGHGFFLPVISLWILWKRKDALQASWGESSPFGLFFVFTGILMLIVGEISAIYILIQYGFLISLIGIVLTSGGVSLAKVSLMPILFLIFAIPLPYFVDAQLSWKLQLLSSQIGVGILRLFGTSVFLEGNVIDLGIYKLQVVDACSGLRYLYPLLSIGFLISYMYQSKLWQKLAVFISAIPITILMNSLRISFVGLLVNKWGSEMADGFLHYFEGWVIFMACLLLLLCEIKIFEYFGLKRPLSNAIDLPDIKVDQILKKSKQLTVAQILTFVTIISASVFVYSFNERAEIHPSRMPLSSFPLTLDAWKARESSLDKQVETALGLDDYVLADYSQPGAKPDQDDRINFYVAYYSSQRKGVSPHSPQVCMPGGGWVITSLQDKEVKVAGVKPFMVNRAVIEREHNKQVVYYWFDQRGRQISNEYWMKWYLLTDSITKNRTDGALVRVTTFLGNNDTLEAADERLAYFLQSAVPKLKLYVPE
jgi:exosortase D (VPLPA-CTERM-specific)